MRHRAASASRRPLAAAIALAGLVSAPPLGAQSVEDDSGRLQSVLTLEREGYQPRRVNIGTTVLTPEIEASAVYDSNIYAAHDHRRSDVLTTLRPRIVGEDDEGRLRWRGQMSAELRRYASTSRENSDSYGASARVAADLASAVTITGGGGYRRAVENRSDPEVRQNPTLGPPLFDVANGELALQGGRGRLGLSLKGQVEKYDFVSSFNNDRDFTSYRGTVRLRYNVAPAINGFVQAYANQRSFRLRDRVSGIDRDGRTLGGLVGVQIDPGGKLRGDVGVGFFRYRPSSATLKGFSGFAVDGTLIYTPRDRIAFILDVFRGDVATVRNGASGRIDSRLRLAIQQEIRHNLLSSVAFRVRRTGYRGVSDRLTTIGGDVDLEYLINRRLSVAFVGQLVKRTSRTMAETFERARAGLELRIRY
ncbi:MULTISPECIES: outer membrane beta-barrel protein [unclassified Sphingomonas]|uniref:outer membrane beta-barrel protein n=1 Tax=unclassified Sphingomonas TaxID=196159 RepID=UPI0006FB5317|nr:MULTISPECIES: outer membrane beta-barrel protein [unclassified Sphingomonas]KQX19489.1 hypothetical protein ASD17_13270 [Sphingomonas sp. Root1294]KQY65690.1 hypothetical protein ASD39_16470 [Sphingomonas sp. Root50]KRB95006.1 hypothetical protein ASE22_03585 [Sphingomonas sp. Root720]